MSKIYDYQEYIVNTKVGKNFKIIDGNPNTIYDDIKILCTKCNKSYDTTSSIVKRRSICFCEEEDGYQLNIAKQRLQEANLEIKIKESAFQGLSKKNVFICPDHGEYEATLRDVLRQKNNGCKKCKPSRKKTFTHDDFIKRLKKRGYDTDLFYYIVPYKDAHADMMIHCNTCHKNFYATPNNFQRNHSCPHCNNIYNKIMGDFISYAKERIKSVHGDRYEIDWSTFVDGSSKITAHCKDHGIFKISLSQLYNGQKCAKCGREQANKSSSISLKEAKQRKKEKHGDTLEVLNWDEYKNTKSRLFIKCKKHNFVFDKTASDFFQGKGCPKCGRESAARKIRMNNNEFLEKANVVHNYKYTYPEKIKGSNKSSVKIICSKHGPFLQRINDHLNGAGCSSCSRLSTKAVEEIKIELDKYNIYYLENDKTVLGGPELDLYFPEHNFAIEYNGLYFHNEGHNHNTVGKDKKYHLAKTDGCNEKGIELFHVFEDEYQNNSEVIIKRILHKLGINDSKTIGARKTKIKEINSKTASKFLNKWHLQGSDTAGVRYGAYHKEELVGVMTFYVKKQEAKLNRFATDLNYKIPGLASKMLKHFIKNNNVNKIITFADRRYTNFITSSVYSKIGFNFVHYTKPSYFYYKSNQGLIRHNRQKFMKHKILQQYPEYQDKNMTEKEMMIDLGYDRIWDCGHMKFEMNVNR